VEANSAENLPDASGGMQDQSFAGAEEREVLVEAVLGFI
jgi:hypothetical protein